jgi:tetratricopeptide (TPR) repeat protein
MKAESIVYAIAGMCFGIILGWIIATQQQPARAAAPVTQVASDAQQQSQSASASGQQAKVLDEARVQQLTTILNSDPKNAGAAVQLGNTYFDAERYPEAINWYEKALAIDPKNADASTDLGVSYYYTKRTDEALKQFENSLRIDPKHTKTLLNKGIVLAFGKQDLNAAAESWRKVVELAPNSPEAQAAQRGLEGIAASQSGAARSGGGSTNQ